MTVIFFITCVIWLIGFMLSVQAMSDESHHIQPHHIQSRTAILIACAFWPIALAVAILRIFFRS